MKKTLLLLLICALSFSAWGTTVVKTVPDLMSKYSWVTMNVYNDFALDDIISVKAAGTSNGTLSNSKWYTYQDNANGSFTISAKEGYIIQSISIVWTANTTNAVLSTVAGKSISADNQIPSGTPFAVNAQSYTFYTGSATANTGNRVTITTFAVTYCLASAAGGETFTEKFDSCGIADAIVTKKFNGNNGVYKWSVKNIRRLNGTNNDELASGQGMRVRYEGYIQSDGNLEGGIKSVAFDWHPTSGSYISDFYVKVGGAEPYHHNSTGVSGTFPFSYDFNVAKNTTLSIEVAAQMTPQQAFQVIGPVTITPYLLFTKKNSEYQYTATQSLDLSTIIINNTGTTPSYSISDGASATIEDGVVKFANKEESFTVTATWGEVSTTTTIAVHALPIPTFTIADVVATMYDGTATPTPEVKVGGEPVASPVITYTSSDENIVKVENEGKVLTILAAGSVTITANLAASETYQAAETTFTLDVTGIQEGDANKVIESYTNVPNYYSQWSSNTEPVEFDGDNTPYAWEVFYYKHDASKSDLDVNGAAGVMLAGKSAGCGYISATMEGGVKAVAFDWKIYKEKKDITAELYAGETLLKTMSYTGLTPGITNRYECALEQKSNVVLKVRNNSENNVYGPITIVPYLLYTVKSAEMWAKDGAYTNTNLINNTGETPTFTLEDNDGEATIDATGAVTALKDGEVTVKASWNEGKVYTTYTLKLHLEAPNASFAASEVEKSIGDAAFTNALTKSESAGTVSYSSSDQTVATVSETGEVTIVNGGTAKITASIAASATCRDTSLYYTVDVKDTPAEGIYWEETFSKCTTENTLETESVTGDSAVYNWSLTNFQRKPIDMVDGKQGMRLRYPSVWTMTNPEGGIKEVVFDWIASGKDMPVHFYVKAGGNEYEYIRDKVGVANKIMHFARQFNETSNVALSLHMSGEKEDPEQTYAVVGPIKIVPYLLFTKKNPEYQYTATQSLDLSTIIINNTGVTPSYSISDGASATIEGSLVTFANKEESFTVTATWGDVSTTTTIAVHALPIPTFTIADVVATMYDGTAAPTPVVKVGDVVQSNPVITYTSSDENIVKVENEGKELSILAAGSVTITANLAASSTYQAAQTTFTLNVTGIQEGDANKVIESYTNVPNYYSQWSSKTDPVDFEGDNTPYSWKVLYYKHDATQNDLNVNGAAGVMLAGKSAGSGYISATMEGGVKAVAFDWKIYTEKKDITAELYAGETLLKTMSYTNLTAGTTGHYECALEQKSNVVLKVRNNSENNVYGPITIVPYLLYTEKEANADLADETYINEQLINNTDEGDITYSIVEETDIATIDAATGEVTLLASGTITVQAQWGDVTTTYELTINRATFTPAFAETEVEKTMDNAAFTIALNGVPDDATGEKTYSSSNERVAKVDNDGEVTIYGIGETTIKVEIAQDGKYNEASAQYTLTVSEPIDEADEVTEAFTGQSWVLTDTEIKGDLCDWTTSQTRRSLNTDSIVSKGVNMGAEWMSGAAGSFGYIQSKAAVDGGVKRIYFTWVKTNDKEANRSFKVTVGDVEDVVDLTGLTEGTYWHNFNIRENSVIRIDNNSASNFKAGPIVITPYIFYQHRADTIMATSYVYPTVYKQTLIDNTGSVGEITYESDNTTAAEVSTTGDVTIKAAAPEPVTITATWKWGENDDEVVTTSYKLFITAKQKRSAEFTNTEVSVARGETPVNEIDLAKPAGDTDPTITYESGDKEVAVVEDNVIKTVGPGTTTITAHIGETDKCLPEDITYKLTVTYTPVEGTYFTETFKNTTTGTIYTAGPDKIQGDDNVYTWNMKQYRRHSDDIFGGEQGTRIRYTTSGSIEAGYIEMDGNQEGGIKEVVFNYCASGPDMEMHYFVQVGETTHDFHPAGKTVAAKSRPYAHDFNVKSNTQLRIYLNTLETPQQTYPIIGEIKITPYLLYTRKDTTINLADYTESTFINDKLIDNRDDEVAIVYSIISENDVASINAETGEVTPLKAGTVTVQAAWGGVTTTYNLTIEPSTTLISEDDENLAELVAAKAGETLDITLQRTMVADEAYSTIFLPFAMNPDQIAAVFGEGTQVAQLLNSELENNVLTFNFDFVTEMSACVPYLIKPTQDVDEANIEGVTIVKPQDPVTVEGGKFNGILAKQPAMDIDGLYFLGDDNILVTYPEIQTQEVQGLRAYFTLTNPTPQLVARCVIGHTHPTILPLVDGKPVNGVKKVIMNNQMIIIRNTDMYNAQGIKIQ